MIPDEIILHQITAWAAAFRQEGKAAHAPEARLDKQWPG